MRAARAGEGGSHREVQKARRRVRPSPLPRGRERKNAREHCATQVGERNEMRHHAARTPGNRAQLERASRRPE